MLAQEQLYDPLTFSEVVAWIVGSSIALAIASLAVLVTVWSLQTAWRRLRPRRD